MSAIGQRAPASDRSSSALGSLRIEPLPPGKAARVLTVDVEDWYHSNFRSAPTLDGRELPSRVEQGIDRLLEMLSEARAVGTFFVLGSVAEEHRTLVKRIAAAGHEIGCHGMTHTLVYEQTAGAFRSSTHRARELLSSQWGRPVLGFRAPSWSITRRSLWAFDALADIGFRYDSSVFPAANYMYGIDGAPVTPYTVRTALGAKLLEVPPSIAGAGRLRIGVGGGFYLRVLPLWVHRRAMRSYARRGAPFLAYIHPREFDPGSWHLELPLSFSERLIHRLGITTAPAKIMRLLRGERWQSIGEMLSNLGA